MGRCTGHCCRFFSLTEPYEEVQTKEWQDKYVDGEEIAAMVIPLNAVPSRIKSYYYTCKHFDGKNCTNYEDRPSMCSNYPYDGKCGVKGCTSSCAEEGGTVTYYELDLIQLESAEKLIRERNG